VWWLAVLSVRSVRAVVREQNTCGLSVWERRASLGICERGRGFHLQRRDVSERLIGLIIQQAVVGVVALQCRSESRLHGEQQQAALTTYKPHTAETSIAKERQQSMSMP